MKRKMITGKFGACLALFLLSIFGLTAAGDAFGQKSKAPRTVEDFYLLLPAKYIEPLARVKNRKKLIKTLDVGNGYLYLDGSDGRFGEWEGWGEVALFKKTNGDYLVGVVDGSCATICYSGVVFLEYKNGKWTEVTERVTPKITDKMTVARYKEINPGATEWNEQNPPYLNYELPRRGTTVKVNANEGGDGNTLLFELVWNGAKFEMKK